MELTSLENLLKEIIIFSSAKDYAVKNSKIKYQRIKIETHYSKGRKGAIVIETPFLLSFGVNERLNQETNQITGYSVPVCLWGKDEEPTPEESMFYKGMKKLFNICHQYLEEGYGTDTASHLSDIFYYKQIEYVDKKGKTKKKKDDKAEFISNKRS